MKRSVVAGAVLLLIGVVLIALRPSDDYGEARKSVGAESKAQRERQVKPIAPAEAFRRLHTFIGAGPTRAPSFEQLDALAPLVSSEELWQLIEASLHDPPWSFGAWVRLAALAELGRREPEATLSRLAHLAHNSTDKNYQIDSALFAVFRGWSEVDPDSAAARLGAREGDFKLSRYKDFVIFEPWRGKAYAVVFAALARADPELAHRYLPPHLPPLSPESFNDPFDYRGHAWEGIFAGLDDPKKIEEYLQVWRDERLPDWQLSFSGPSQPCHAQSNVRFAAMMRLAAIYNELPQPNRFDFIGEFKNEVGIASMFGQRHPDRALELIRGGAPNHEWLARGAMWAHPERAVDVVRALPDSAMAMNVISDALRGQGRDCSHSVYPAPGRNNRLPNFAANYRHFEAAIEAAAVKPEQRTELITLLNEEIRPSLRRDAPPAISNDP